MRSILLVLAAVALAGCGTLDSGVEDLTLRYGGGITEEKAYKGMRAGHDKPVRVRFGHRRRLVPLPADATLLDRRRDRWR